METNYEQRTKCKAEAIKKLCEKAHEYLEMVYKEYKEGVSFNGQYTNILRSVKLTPDEEKEVNNIIDGCDTVDYFVNTFYKLHQQEIDCREKILAMILNAGNTQEDEKAGRPKEKADKLEEFMD